MGLGNVSPAQLASILGPEKMAVLQQMDGLRPLRAQEPPSISSQLNKVEEDEESFIRGRKQDIEHAKEVLEASTRHLSTSKSSSNTYTARTQGNTSSN